MTNGWASAKPKTRTNNLRLEDEIEVYDFPKNKWVKVRMFGPITSYMQLWFEIISSKQKKKVKIPKICLDYNPKTEEMEREICPFRKLGGQMTQNYITNMIIRDIQEEGPPKNAGKRTESERKKVDVLGGQYYVKEKGSKTWTPVRAKTWSATMAEKFGSLKTLNTVKDPKTGKKIEFDITHPKYGKDILLKWNPDSKSPIKWEIQLEERTPLTEQELNYLIQDIAHLDSVKPMSLAQAKMEAKELEKLLADRDTRKDVDEDEDDPKPARKRPSRDEDEDDAPPPRRKRPVVDEDDSYDDGDDGADADDSYDDGDGDDSYSDDDGADADDSYDGDGDDGADPDDGYGDDGDDGDDGYEEPPPRRRVAPAPAKKRPPPPPPRRAGPPAKKRPGPAKDEFDDEDDF